jgi:hypothetical protein
MNEDAGSRARTEDDVRSALRDLQRHAPAPDQMLRVLGESSTRRRAGRPGGRTRMLSGTRPELSWRGRGWPGGPRWLRWAGPAAAALAVLAVAAALTLTAGTRGHHGVPRSRPQALPGGGRILLYAPGYGLEWVYRGSRTVPIARGFIGAQLVLGGRRLLAWRPTQNPRATPPCPGCFADVDYYLMKLNGTGRRLVLRAEGTAHRVQVGHDSVQLSPDGKMLAWLRITASKPAGNQASDRLWVADLATGKRADLGPGGSALAWASDSTLVTESPDRSALDTVNVSTGHRTTFASVRDPRIARAYEHARPGAGPPVTIDPVGPAPGSGQPVFAVTVWGGSRRFPANAAVVLIGRGPALALAPGRFPLVSLTWGLGGRFVLDSTLAENAAPPDLYAGTATSPRLYHLPSHGNATGFSYSPDRTLIAEGYEDGSVYLVPTPPALCRHSPGCGRRHASVLSISGTLYGWAQ